MKETKPCIKCGSKIINKEANSIYCKDCAYIYRLMIKGIDNAMYYSRKKYPHLKINYKLKVMINKQ